MSALSKEPPEEEGDSKKEAIAEQITDLINSVISHDEENVMKWFSPKATQLRSNAQKEMNDIGKLSDFSCGPPKVLRYEHPNPNTLSFEFSMECNGFDPATSNDVNRIIAKKVVLNRDENNDSWQIVYSQDIAPSETPSVK